MVRLGVLLAAVVMGSGVAAQEQRIGSYMALLGAEDLVNSRGQRLTNAAAIVRQDRANFHKFGVRHRYDEADPWFGSVNARNGMEGLVRMSPSTADVIVRQGALVAVSVYARGGRISAITVEIPG